MESCYVVFWINHIMVLHLMDWCIAWMRYLRHIACRVLGLLFCSGYI